MELKTFISKIKNTKSKNLLINLTHAVLSLEENIIEISNSELLINQLGEVLKDLFLLIHENKIDVNNEEIKDLDLDIWKDNIKLYKTTNTAMNREVYLYTMRIALKNLLVVKITKETTRLYLFELIIKTFLFIDYMNLSIDSILELKLKEGNKTISSGENWG